MAWACSGTSNSELVNNMAANGLINSDRVKNAMLGVRTPPKTLPLFNEPDIAICHLRMYLC